MLEVVSMNGGTLNSFNTFFTPTEVPKFIAIGSATKFLINIATLSYFVDPLFYRYHAFYLFFHRYIPCHQIDYGLFQDCIFISLVHAIAVVVLEIFMDVLFQQGRLFFKRHFR
jgi:hypothetical protein